MITAGQPSFSRISARIRAASAWPRMAFMTWPIRAPAACDLAGTYLLDDVRVGAQRLVDGRGERVVVGDEGETTLRDHLRRRALPRYDAIEDLPRQLVVDRAVVDQRLDLGDLLRRHSRILQVDSHLVRPPGHFSQPPLAGRLRRSAGGHGGLDRVQRAGADHVAKL